MDQLIRLIEDNPDDHGLLQLLDELWEVHSDILQKRYVAPRGVSAGRHGNEDILNNLIMSFAEETFLNHFRMHRRSFWILVEIVTPRWPVIVPISHPYPIYQQLAVGLYVLGSAGGGGLERTRVSLNISKGAVDKYLWRTIAVISRLLPTYVKWPSAEERSIERDMRDEGVEGIFQDCVGFLDGSIIILREKPQMDPEAYFSRKKEYGINLQAVCDWERRFIFASLGYTAATHDSTAFKNSDLYLKRSTYFKKHEYLLADKAYALERHIIVPFKDPYARHPPRAAFNSQLSIPRVRIEHAFGLLKARFLSLRNLPVRIGENIAEDHYRVAMWISTCLVLVTGKR